MRTFLVVGLMLAALLPPPAQAQSSLATIDPTLYFWDDYERSFARFEVRVTNTGSQTDAFTITEIRIEPDPGQPIGAIYSPTPTLPLAAGAQGNFRVWVGGFEQPSPPGPPAGDYVVRVKVQSTLDPQRQQTLEATIRRSHPPPEATGTIHGTLHDSLTGEVPRAFGAIEVTAHDPQNVRVLPESLRRATIGADGAYRFELPPGQYWIRVEASGYRTEYVRMPALASGSSLSADIALSPNAIGRFEAQAPQTGRSNLPTYRFAASLDLASVATTPGFYTRQPGSAPESLLLMTADGTARWSRALPPVSNVPFDSAAWTSTDHGVDVTQDGQRIAVGTAGGTIQVYDADGADRWPQPYRGEGDVNPLVPGPLGQGLRRSSEVRFSNDGQWLAAGSLTGWVYLFDAFNGTLQWKTPTAGQVRALRFSPDDGRLYAGSGDNKLYALDARTGAVVWTTGLDFWPFEHIGLSGDGTFIATGGKDGVLRLFDDTGRQLWSRVHPGFVLGFDLSPTGQQVVAMTGQGIYSYDRAGTLRWFRGEIQNNGQLRIGSAGKYMGYGKSSTSANEPAMRVLSNDGTLGWEFRTHEPETIYNVHVLDDGQRIAANGRSGTVYFFDFWSRPPTGTRAPPTSGAPQTTSPEGDSPAPALLLAFAAVAGAAALRRRQD